jgi:dihydroxyacetone kinase DhaKLM complex PTS-EIIA-like component DhaM
VQPDEAGGRVAQSLAVEAEGLAGLLLVEALELAGFGGEDGGELGEEATAVSRAVCRAATPDLAAYCT